jgi:hypothetical protein
LKVAANLVSGFDFPWLTLKLARTGVPVSLETSDRREQFVWMHLSGYHRHKDVFTHRCEVKLRDTWNLFQLFGKIYLIKPTVLSAESNIHSLVRSFALARIENKSEGNTKDKIPQELHWDLLFPILSPS